MGSDSDPNSPFVPLWKTGHRLAPVNKRVYDLVWGTSLRTTTALHRVVHKLSGGRVWRRFPGGGVIVWITTLGRKSGEWRTNPLLSVQVDGDWIITGSNAGQAKVPGWVFNAREHPEGFVLIDDGAWRCTFVEVDGAERDALYNRLVKIWKSYEMYAENAGRTIPVFRIRLGERIAKSSIPSE